MASGCASQQQRPSPPPQEAQPPEQEQEQSPSAQSADTDQSAEPQNPAERRSAQQMPGSTEQASDTTPDRQPGSTPPSPSGRNSADGEPGANVQQADRGDTQASEQGRAPDGSQARGLTRDERIGEFDGAFDESLSAFDERLRREEVAIAAARESAEASAAAQRQSRSEPGGSSGGHQDAGRSSAPTAPGQPANEDATSRNPRGTPGNRADRYPPPDDVGDGSDDDIVARQLREAAETEEDPELRAKLWEEYRDYKAGS